MPLVYISAFFFLFSISHIASILVCISAIIIIITALDAGVANLETGLFTSVHKQCPRCDTQGTQARIPPRNEPMYPRQFHFLGRLNAQAWALLVHSCLTCLRTGC